MAAGCKWGWVIRYRLASPAASGPILDKENETGSSQLRAIALEVRMAVKVKDVVIEKCGTCDICKRFMTNQQELMEFGGKTIHRACMPSQVVKKPNTFHI